jgi:chloride channel protein, CIC family
MTRLPSLRGILRSENFGAVTLAISVGLIGGLGAILFRYLIDGADWLFFSGGARALSFLGGDYVILLPVIGMVIVSTIVRKWAPEAEGHGVPEVMYAVKKQGGRIRPRVVGIKAIASAICIGSGGSVGREGPIVQIGCTIGSAFGQYLKLDERRIKLLVACGAAAGIAGTFNAPIAGVIFALEVILGTFAARSFGLVVISSVASTALCRAVLGDEPAFVLREVFHLESFLELPLYLVLGLFAGIFAFLVIRILYFFEEFFAAWKLPAAAKAAIAGLGVGLIGWFGIHYLGGRYLFGVGYDGIQAALQLGKPDGLEFTLSGGLTITALLLLVVLKIPAMSLTLAGGGSGGVFAPSIFVGAMLGGAFGLAANALFPAVTAPAGAYALVGMGAVFAGTAHAPVTSILILFEMTDDYKIILPLMIAVVISHLLSATLSPDSIYLLKLRRRGGLTPPAPRSSVLDQILVADALGTDFETVSPEETVERLTARFHAGHLRAFEVLDDESRLVGIVTEYDVESAFMAGDVATKRVEDIMTRDLVVVTPRQTMHEVVEELNRLDVGQIPVVSSQDPTKLVGVLRRAEVFWAYGQLSLEHRKMLKESVKAMAPDHGDAVQIRLTVERSHGRLCFKKIKEILVPDQCLIVMLHRGERAVVPRGDTVVEPGDTLVLMTIRAREPGLRQWMESLRA